MRKLVVIAALLTVALAVGCGKGAKNEKQGKEAFQVPDSLLAPIAGYHLTVDTYHVVNGGVMASPQIELRYPSSEIARFVAVKTFGFAKDAYEKVSKEIGRPADGKLVLIGTADLDEYLLMTRKEWWYYGLVKGDTIIFEPLDIMLKRIVAQPGITNRIAQVAINKRSGRRSPLWLKEALATRIAGEAEILKIQMPEAQKDGRNMNPAPDRIEQTLSAAVDREDSRVAYYASCRMLDKLLTMHSMDNVLSFFDRLKEGKTLDEASEKAFGVSYGALIDKIRIDR